ncbi:hypothetical protein Y1Q_0010197 [Alligator mississippiensis]|uniref:Uncharacterized protein n=1 Tax=Alligator mississippiensis TaxID=8496 RepID=A0A151NG40_ALLMI|nr:hypothetical protein Y1Q_0010197 [Alligator mississippiensis]
MHLLAIKSHESSLTWLICISYMLQASTPHFKHAVNFCIAHPANCRLLFMHSAKETVAFHASDVPQARKKRALFFDRESF